MYDSWPGNWCRSLCLQLRVTTGTMLNRRVAVSTAQLITKRAINEDMID